MIRNFNWLPWCREQCVWHSPVQWKNMRTVPSRRENKDKCTVPCGRKKKKKSLRGRNYIPSRPVVKIVCALTSRRAKIRIPSRPVVTNFIYRPVPSWQILFTVSSCLDTKRSTYCYSTVPSRPENWHTHRLSHLGNYNFHCFTVPSRLQLF